jgi:hypothetical protein
MFPHPALFCHRYLASAKSDRIPYVSRPEKKGGKTFPRGKQGSETHSSVYWSLNAGARGKRQSILWAVRRKKCSWKLQGMGLVF